MPDHNQSILAQRMRDQMGFTGDHHFDFAPSDEWVLKATEGTFLRARCELAISMENLRMQIFDEIHPVLRMPARLLERFIVWVA